MQVPVDDAGPTAERLAKACEFSADGKKVTRKYYDEVGRSRSKHFTMSDDALGRAWMRQIISGEEYSALRRYALHWVAGGLQGPISSVDLNRIYAFDPSSMSGLAKSEAQLDHKRTYYAASQEIGFRPAFVATQVACFGRTLLETGEALGDFRSPGRGRTRAAEILKDAGYRLGQFWESLRR